LVEGDFGLEALKAITLYPAQLAGVADRLGSIAADKDASPFASSIRGATRASRAR